jgi:DNA-binding GntR family transcriptional regulator
MPKAKPTITELGPLKMIGRKKSLGQHVYQDLRKTIIRGDIASGHRLVESQIAEVMGISRTPVREALHKLEREGLIGQREKGGFTIVGFTRDDIEETFGIRGALESYAAGLAAIRHRPEELVALEKKIDDFQECLDSGRLKPLVKINTEFHQMLYALSGNTRLIAMIGTLRDQFYRYREMILKKKILARESNEDHRQMLKYIRKRDVAGTEELVKQHILKGQEAVLADFDNIDNHH